MNIEQLYNKNGLFVISNSLSIILCLIFISCSNSHDYSRIKVGMTYDEVESILKRPESITRGANELYTNTENLSSDILERLNLDTTNITNTPNRWLAPKEIRTVGNLIYVTWIYKKVKRDTFYIKLNNFNEIKDTITYKVHYYYLGGKIVSKSKYQKSDGYEYRLNNNEIVDKAVYEVYKSHPNWGKLPKPQKIVKQIVYKLKKSVNSHLETSSTEKNYYEVVYKYCVIFDASSGRVTNKGFFPSEINVLTK